MIINTPVQHIFSRKACWCAGQLCRAWAKPNPLRVSALLAAWWKCYAQAFFAAEIRVSFSILRECRLNSYQILSCISSPLKQHYMQHYQVQFHYVKFHYQVALLAFVSTIMTFRLPHSCLQYYIGTYLCNQKIPLDNFSKLVPVWVWDRHHLRKSWLQKVKSNCLAFLPINEVDDGSSIYIQARGPRGLQYHEVGEKKENNFLSYCNIENDLCNPKSKG